MDVAEAEVARLNKNDGASVLVPPHDVRNWKDGVLYFKNGVYSVDFVLVWDKASADATTQAAYEMRETFERNLTEEGLKLEHEVEEKASLNFIKIHAPIPVMKRYAEILKLRFPLKDELNSDFLTSKHNSIVKKHMVYDEGSQESIETDSVDSFLENASPRLAQCLKKYVYIDRSIFPETGFKCTATFSKDKEYLFDVSSDNFFTSKSRAMVVSFILERTLFGKQSQKSTLSFGIDRLVHVKVYSSAYALHDVRLSAFDLLVNLSRIRFVQGSLETPGSLRYTLFHQWASYRNLVRYQPLDYIREYLGGKLALYFTWLGFYTFMLAPAALVGLIVFFAGIIAATHDEVSHDICDGDDIIMCPRCELFCEFWTLNRACAYATIISYFDNKATIFLATFVSIWAALFLEFWKRYSAEITHRWGLSNYDDIEEVPRPQYLAQAEKHRAYKMNRVTGKEEKKVPRWRTLSAITFSFSIVLFLVFLALAACAAVIIYRTTVITSLSLYGYDMTANKPFSSYIILVINATAGVLNLAFVMCFGLICNRLSIFLTEFEVPRTQTQFEDSATFKMYLLEFVNYYSSIFYVAFIKGRFIGHPAKYNRIWGSRQEECSIGGCMFDVTTQLAIIMVGKQIVISILELVKPIAAKFFKVCRKSVSLEFIRSKPQWMQDYFLNELNIFDEYLEMVLQYGFITIFAVAFPLAPLCALINNIFECRNDAHKILKYYRRPVARRVSSIGVWLNILGFVSKLAVFTNALIIGFTSEFIPHFVYRYFESSDGTLYGYIDFSLSYMNVSDLDGTYSPTNETYCRYKDYREPPWSDDKYETTSTFWIVLAARLIFVLVFENIVLTLVQMIDWLIPDVTRKVRQKIRREAYIVYSINIEQAKKASQRKRGNNLLN